MAEGVDQLNYLERILDQSDDYWSPIIRNTKKEQKVWGWMGNILRCEEADTQV